MKKCKNMAVADEPMDLWEKTAGINLLEEFYKEPKKWAFLFQTKILLTLR